VRKKRQRQCGVYIDHHPTNIQLVNKRYLILTYNTTYDKSLSFIYYRERDSVILMQQIR
jgi:hypothetical protein